jgi:hypothetical protein
MVIEAHSPKYTLLEPVVAVYPKEGAFWSDHRAGIVDRPWVSAQHKEAAQTYLDFPLARPQQQKAMRYGFRPADVDIPLGAPFDAVHGVDPKEPKTTLSVAPAKGFIRQMGGCPRAAVEQGIARGFAILPCRSERVRRVVASQVVSGTP